MILEQAFDRQTFSKYYSQKAYDLDILMNTLVKEALEIPSNVHWGSQANDVFDYLAVDFMKPVINVGTLTA